MTHAELGEMLDYVENERCHRDAPRLRKLFYEMVRLRGVIMAKQYGVFRSDCDCPAKQRCAWCEERRGDRHDDSCPAFTVDGVVK